MDDPTCGQPVTHRVVVDESGVQWEAWEVHPTLADRRRTDVVATPVGKERRHHRSARSPLPGSLMRGWLAMRSATERRRIAPVPEGWDEMSDDALRTMIAGAPTNGRPRRLMD